MPESIIHAHGDGSIEVIREHWYGSPTVRYSYRNELLDTHYLLQHPKREHQNVTRLIEERELKCSQ